MTLRDLLREIPDQPAVGGVGDASVGDTRVTSVAYDSRQAGPGSVFVALRGVQADGASFAREALGRWAGRRNERHGETLRAQGKRATDGILVA